MARRPAARPWSSPSTLYPIHRYSPRSPRSCATDQVITASLDATDPDQTQDTLILSAQSSNTSLLKDSKVAFTHNGSDWEMKLTPAPDQTGTSSVTVLLRDDTDRTVQQSFDFIVSDPAPQGNITLTPATVAENNELLTRVGTVVVDSAGEGKERLVYRTVASESGETRQFLRLNATYFGSAPQSEGRPGQPPEASSPLPQPRIGSVARLFPRHPLPRGQGLCDASDLRSAAFRSALGRRGIP